ncbi:AbrB family transcriptional regulator [Rhodobium gokarnense]|uniref:Membrane AbrB-like protein n=1 Tax=Rhodobium gokarnense TaxID=364296 RepID=A0ABT3H669_9HYPH|nr:AbrB family transcriptional regulator [Rhodobium gokarnense]MCW2305880.1 membrane AbrB-like protein [Rhodobium gokarnense]
MTASFRALALQWAGLGVLSAAVIAVLKAVHMPGAVILGAIVAAVAVALAGAELELPKASFLAAQALMGAMLAGMIEASIFRDIADYWVALGLALATMLAAAVLVGWLVERSGRLPPGTGTWGALPGAAPAMILMAGEFGGDMRFVAVMQYLRVLVVVLIASLVTQALFRMVDPGAVVATAKAAAPSLAGFGGTIGVAVVGAVIGVFSRVPAGAIIGPLLIGGAVNIWAPAALHFPGWLAWAIFIAIGWTIGLKFRRQMFRALVASLPVMLVSILSLVLLSAISAWLLVLFADRDPVTAFLATSPGGLDTVAILALESRADVAFVLTLQTLRLFATVLVGTVIARILTNKRKTA